MTRRCVCVSYGGPDGHDAKHPEPHLLLLNLSSKTRISSTQASRLRRLELWSKVKQNGWEDQQFLVLAWSCMSDRDQSALYPDLDTSH